MPISKTPNCASRRHPAPATEARPSDCCRRAAEACVSPAVASAAFNAFLRRGLADAAVTAAIFACPRRSAWTAIRSSASKGSSTKRQAPPRASRASSLRRSQRRTLRKRVGGEVVVRRAPRREWRRRIAILQRPRIDRKPRDGGRRLAVEAAAGGRHEARRSSELPISHGQLPPLRGRHPDRRTAAPTCPRSVPSRAPCRRPPARSPPERAHGLADRFAAVSHLDAPGACGKDGAADLGWILRTRIVIGT